MWAIILRTLLQRDMGSPAVQAGKAQVAADSTGDAMASLLRDGLWSAVLGEATDDRFVCDHAAGWGSPHGAPAFSLPPPSMFRSAAEVSSQLARAAPIAPSEAELATGCGPNALACVVVAAHRTSAAWAHSAGLPVLEYKRQVR
jgi:hypothetical protein